MKAPLPPFVLLLAALIFGVLFYNNCSGGFEIRSPRRDIFLGAKSVFTIRVSTGITEYAGPNELYPTVDSGLNAQQNEIELPVSLFCSQAVTKIFNDLSFARAGNPVLYLYDDNRMVICAKPVFEEKQSIIALRRFRLSCPGLLPLKKYHLAVLNAQKSFSPTEILPLASTEMTQDNGVSLTMFPGSGPRFNGPQVDGNLLFSGASVTTNSAGGIDEQAHWVFLLFSSYPGIQENYYDKYDSRACSDPNYIGGKGYWRLYPPVPRSVLQRETPVLVPPATETCKLYSGSLGASEIKAEEEFLEGPFVSSATGTIGASLLLPESSSSHLDCDGKATPLIIDFSNTSGPSPLKLSSIDSGVLFDIMGALSPRGPHSQLRISWLKSVDFFWLALPKDGKISGIDQLFGDNTLGPDRRFAANGYQALAKFDGNRDQVIDETDLVFSKLALWSDRNLNGVAESNEIFSLSSMKVKSIDLRYDRRFLERDSFGNETRMRSVVNMKDGGQRMIFDLWFKIRGD